MLGNRNIKYYRNCLERQTSLNSDDERNCVFDNDDMVKIMNRNNQTTIQNVYSRRYERISDNHMQSNLNVYENIEQYVQFDDIMAMDKFTTVKLDDWTVSKWGFNRETMIYRGKILEQSFATPFLDDFASQNITRNKKPSMWKRFMCSLRVKSIFRRQENDKNGHTSSYMNYGNDPTDGLDLTSDHHTEGATNELEEKNEKKDKIKQITSTRSVFQRLRKQSISRIDATKRCWQKMQWNITGNSMII